MAQRSVYLAGPEVFLPNALAIGEAKMALCVECGFTGLYPGASKIPEGSPAEIARFLYDTCVGMMGKADLIIANVTPFRGPSADVGTAFELGHFKAQGKPAFVYSNARPDFAARTRALDAKARTDARGMLVDGDGLLIEEFGLYDNLMLGLGLAAPPVLREVPHAERYTDLGGLRACLELARRHG